MTHPKNPSASIDQPYQGCPFLRDYRDLVALTTIIDGAFDNRRRYLASCDPSSRHVGESEKSIEDDLDSYNLDFSKRFGKLTLHCALIR